MDFSKITDVISSIGALFKFSKSPAPTLFPPLILTGVPRKSGISAQRIANNIIKNKEKAGLPVGTLPDGSPSPDEIMERIRAEAIVEEIISNAKITVVIPAGTPLTAAGGNAGGPVVVQGATINITTGYAQIQ